MEPIYVRDVVNAVGGEFLVGDPHATVGRISTDTRTLRKGDFYVALKGANFDGHDFLRQAVEREAGGLVVSRADIDLGNPFPVFPVVIKTDDTLRALGAIAALHRARWDGTLVGITGSNGKTTTKEMLAAILGRKGSTLSNAGNFNNLIGVPLTLLRLAGEHEYAVVEMGTSAPGEIGRLAEVASPRVSVITNIGFSHLERLRDLDGVFREKRSLFDGTADGGWRVVNGDDPYLATLRGGEGVVTFGFGPDSDVRAERTGVTDGYPRFTLVLGETSVEVKLPVYGVFNVANALAAAAAAWKLGVSAEDIRNGLETFSAPQMRMETRVTGTGITLVNDAYNANPSSVRAAVDAFVQSFPDRDKYLVLGDMLELGGSAEAEHESLGKYLAGQRVRHVFLYGPHMERAASVNRDNPSVSHFRRKDEMEQALRRRVTPGAAVFFKASRGMALEEVVRRMLDEES